MSETLEISSKKLACSFDTCHGNQLSSSMARFDTFIKSTRTNELFHSHVLLGSPYGKINVSNSRMKEFWDIYADCVSESAPLFLAEKPSQELPVLVDVDLKTRLNSTVSKKIYSSKNVKTVVKTYQTILKEKVLQNVSEEALTCVLLEKPSFVMETNGIKFVKNGFHLHFPKLFIDSNVQEAYIIPLVKDQLSGLFDNLYTVDDGRIDESRKPVPHYDFIDSASVRVHWLMYGSRKPGNKPYVATKCFLAGAVETDFESALGDYILPQLKGENEPQSCEGNVMKLLPRILSTRLHGRIQYYFKARPSVNTPIFEQFETIKQKRPIFVQKTVNDVMKEVEKLMPLINDKRADDRGDWLAIGFCLMNITDGDADGLSAWLEFSDRSPKCNEAECICLWNSRRENNFSLGTLKYFAKLDSPVEYEALCKKHGDELIDMAVDGGHNDLAKILYNEYGQEFVFSTINSSWYRFTNHIWEKSESPKVCFQLSERISDNNGAILNQFIHHLKLAEKERKILSKKTDDDENEIQVAMLTRKIQTLTKLIKSCKANSFKTSVMKECQEVFRNDSFSDKLNTNPYLVAFKNGVYDFKNDCFRDGKPEDYLSVSLSFDYKDFGSRDCQEVLEVASFFRKIFPDDSIRQYFLDQVSQLFIGGNHDKVILIWTGSGDNGKSVTQRLFEKMLGQLSVKISTTMITGRKSNLGQASPELARTGNGVRMVVMDEPNKDEKITTGIVKTATGNDSFFARDLYQGGNGTKEIIPLFKIHMLCNELPSVKNPDDAFWERVRVIPFESKFVSEEKCPLTYEEQMSKKIFPKDPQFQFGKKIEEMIQPLAWFLISHWRGLNKTERIVPEKVKIATGEYRDENSNDPYQEFAEENLTRGQGKIKCDKIVEKFKEWFKRENPREKPPTKKVIINCFNKILGKPDSTHWVGWEWTECDSDEKPKKLTGNPLMG